MAVDQQAKTIREKISGEMVRLGLAPRSDTDKP